MERITARKPKLYVLNKADLADPAVTEEWIRYFRAADAGCVAISAKQKGGTKAVQTAIEKELASLLERRQNRGMGGAKTQVMLCGQSPTWDNPPHQHLCRLCPCQGGRPSRRDQGQTVGQHRKV